VTFPVVAGPLKASLRRRLCNLHWLKMLKLAISWWPVAAVAPFINQSVYLRTASDPCKTIRRTGKENRRRSGFPLYGLTGTDIPLRHSLPDISPIEHVPSYFGYRGHFLSMASISVRILLIMQCTNRTFTWDFFSFVLFKTCQFSSRESASGTGVGVTVVMQHMIAERELSTEVISKGL